MRSTATCANTSRIGVRARAGGVRADEIAPDPIAPSTLKENSGGRPATDCETEDLRASTCDGQTNARRAPVLNRTIQLDENHRISTPKAWNPAAHGRSRLAITGNRRGICDGRQRSRRADGLHAASGKDRKST